MPCSFNTRGHARSLPASQHASRPAWLPLPCLQSRQSAFPVDTHIHRLAARWGLSDGTTVERTERDLKLDTLAGVLDEYPELADVAVVPLGVSDHNSEERMRPHTLAEAAAVVDTVERWQATFAAVLTAANAETVGFYVGIDRDRKSVV